MTIPADYLKKIESHSALSLGRDWRNTTFDFGLPFRALDNQAKPVGEMGSHLTSSYIPPLSPRNPRSLEGSLARVHAFGRIVKIRINEILTTSMYELSFTFNSGTKFGYSMSTVEGDEEKEYPRRLHAAESTAKSDEKAPP